MTKTEDRPDEWETRELNEKLNTMLEKARKKERKRDEWKKRREKIVIDRSKG